MRATTGRAPASGTNRRETAVNEFVFGTAAV
jgi:hypothetical protein